MTSPNEMVENHGETVTLERVTSPVYDSYDELDEGASTVEEVDIKAVISQPEEGGTTRPEGKAALRRLQATVKSDIDISATREGGADAIIRNGKRYKVGQVIDDRHPIVDMERKKVILEPRPGR